jgi:F0F1-type ATP synthase assembly protein I
VPSEELGWSELLNLGLVSAVAIVAGLGLGWLVDSLVGTPPIFLFLGLVLGVAGAVRYTYVELRKYLKH